MPLGPAQVHAQQDLRPVGCLGAAGARADRQDRVSVVVLAAKEQARALALVVAGDGLELAVEVRLQASIAIRARELRQVAKVAGPLLKLAPGGELLPEPFRGAEDSLRGARIGPEIGLARLRV
jgi:hypothetical protein